MSLSKKDCKDCKRDKVRIIELIEETPIRLSKMFDILSEGRGYLKRSDYWGKTMTYDDWEKIKNTT